MQFEVVDGPQQVYLRTRWYDRYLCLDQDGDHVFVLVAKVDVGDERYTLATSPSVDQAVITARSLGMEGCPDE